MNCWGVHIILFSNPCCTQLSRSRSVFVVGPLSISPYKALFDMRKPMNCRHHHHLYQGSKLSPILDVPTSVSGFSCTRSTITLIQRERMRKGTIYVFSIIHACMILCGLSFLLKWLLASDALASAKIIGSSCTCIIRIWHLFCLSSLPFPVKDSYPEAVRDTMTMIWAIDGKSRYIPAHDARFSRLIGNANEE